MDQSDCYMNDIKYREPTALKNMFGKNLGANRYYVQAGIPETGILISAMVCMKKVRTSFTKGSKLL